MVRTVLNWVQNLAVWAVSLYICYQPASWIFSQVNNPILAWALAIIVGVVVWLVVCVFLQQVVQAIEELLTSKHHRGIAKVSFGMSWWISIIAAVISFLLGMLVLNVWWALFSAAVGALFTQFGYYVWARAQINAATMSATFVADVYKQAGIDLGKPQ